MGRIESIKNNFHFAKHGEKQGDTDIEYLLQRLEIAQKALEKTLEIDGYMFVKDALDQLKE